ncbi:MULTISPECIES: hypothetical protein [unclassified Bradyrhizobium]|uniref:hypothetical protein n=1 Tax=unclassified Bradyrhizobium TaxID=2631580 RepID=UPI0028E1F3A3|nr:MULTISPECIES: hypothetical protein [unclassified Bradyrhizobium]
MPATVWSTSFHSSFSVVPAGKLTDKAVDLFLNGEGQTDQQLLAQWPYDEARGAQGGTPDPKRYRDMRQLLQTIGLVYDEVIEGKTVVHVTELGKALARWRPSLLSENVRIIARHGSLALAACQLRNPTRNGMEYDPIMKVFPFQFIWKAMLALDNRITSDELNREIYRTKDEADLAQAIQRIRQARLANDLGLLSPEVISGDRKNDRVLVWVGWASFGWSLITDKRNSADGQSYTIKDRWALRTLQAAAQVKHRHRDFQSVPEYVEYLSRCAAIPMNHL